MNVPEFERYISSRITSISTRQVESVALRLTVVGFDADAEVIRNYVLEHKKYIDLLERRLRERNHMRDILVSISVVSTIVAIGMSLFCADLS